MKRLFLASAAALALTASSAIADDQLRTQLQNELDSSSIMIDVSQLSDEQVSELHFATTSTDDHGERKNKVEAVLLDAGYMTMNMGDATMFVPADIIKVEVQEGMAQYGYELDVSALSNPEIAELYMALNKADEIEVKNSIESVLN